VVCHGLTHRLAVAAHQIEDPRRKPCLVDDLRQDERTQGDYLAWLENDGATGSQGRRHLGNNLVERIIPRRDAGRHPCRLLDYQ